MDGNSKGLAYLREPFPAHQISKLPKETKQQIEERKNNRAAGIKCEICGSWHHKNAVHLDYVGHAALTARLLDCDPAWNWDPCAFGVDGLPAFDRSGGLWIKLTVCGVTRLGYGHAADKSFADPGAREKEVIGDALRNAAMRFGAALELWHKGDLYIDEDPQPKPVSPVSIPGNVACKDAATALDADTLDMLSRAAETIEREAVESSSDAAHTFDGATGDDAEQKKALWSMLSSGARSKIKAFKASK